MYGSSASQTPRSDTESNTAAACTNDSFDGSRQPFGAESLSVPRFQVHAVADTTMSTAEWSEKRMIIEAAFRFSENVLSDLNGLLSDSGKLSSGSEGEALAEIVSRETLRHIERFRAGMSECASSDGEWSDGTDQVINELLDRTNEQWVKTQGQPELEGHLDMSQSS